MPLFETPALWLPSYGQGFASPQHMKPANPGLWKGLIGLWVPSLGPIGLTLFDHSGFGNNGTLTNMDLATDWIMSPNGYALDFDGSNDYVQITNQYTSLDNGKPFSVAWASRSKEASPTAEGLFGVYGANGYYFWTYYWDLTTSGIYSNVGNGVSYRRECAVGFDLTTWHNFAAVFDGGALENYVDGKINGQAGAGSPGNPTYTETRLGIGHESFNGKVEIGWLGLWNRVLLPDECQFLSQDPHAIVRPMQRVLVEAAGAPPAFGGVNQIIGGGMLCG